MRTKTHAPEGAAGGGAPLRIRPHASTSYPGETPHVKDNPQNPTGPPRRRPPADPVPGLTRERVALAQGRILTDLGRAADGLTAGQVNHYTLNSRFPARVVRALLDGLVHEGRLGFDVREGYLGKPTPYYRLARPEGGAS